MAESLLESVLRAQDDAQAGYRTALREIETGHKESCWIWWIWPTLAGVRTTSRPEFYVPDAEAALAWMRHPKLGPRFIDITRAAIFHLCHGVRPKTLFGQQVDVDKFHECVTLFMEVAKSNNVDEVERVCQEALAALRQQPHAKTLGVLRAQLGAAQHRAQPSTELASFLATLNLGAHAEVMQAEGFGDVGSLGTLDVEDAKEMAEALGKRGVPHEDVGRILRAAKSLSQGAPLAASATSSGRAGTAAAPLSPQRGGSGSSSDGVRCGACGGGSGGGGDFKTAAGPPPPSKAAFVAGAVDDSRAHVARQISGGASVAPPDPQRERSAHADVAPAEYLLKKLNRATMAFPSSGEKLRPLCSPHAPGRTDATLGWVCVQAAHGTPEPAAPRLLALDAEMIERRAEGVRLPVSAALIQYDLPPSDTSRVLFSGLLDPSAFDPLWLSGEPAAYDYKEAWVGLDHAHLAAAHARGQMTPVSVLQRLVLDAFHGATYFVGHALGGDLKVLRLHGAELAHRVIDTQALFPLPGGGHARLRALVQSMLPADEWAGFQADGQAHPPDKDAKAALALVKRELQLLAEQPDRLIGMWDSSMAMAATAQPGSAVAGAHGAHGANGGIRPLAGEDSAMVLLVAESDVGRLLGKKGAKIAQLRAESGAQLKLLSPAESQELVVGVRGSAEETKRVLRVVAHDRPTLDRACALVHAAVLTPPVLLVAEH